MSQLNLFSFVPTIRIFRAPEVELQRKLFRMVIRHDKRSYGFGGFGYCGGYKKTTQKDLNKCSVVIAYKRNVIVGFCTITRWCGDKKIYSLDVWVKPYYRDMGLGSALVNAANKECLHVRGILPKGHDKNHEFSWNKVLKEWKDREEQLNRPWHFHDGSQLNLFPKKLKKRAAA